MIAAVVEVATQTLPPVPSATAATLATDWPPTKLTLLVFGWGWPQGHTVNQPGAGRCSWP